MPDITIHEDVVLPVDCGSDRDKRSCFMVKQLECGCEVDLLGQPFTLALHWAEGMVGVLPVFDSKEAAERYAGKAQPSGDSFTLDNN